MQVRLSLSKVGRLTTPRRVVRRVDMRSFGGPVYLRSHTSDISVLKEQLVSGGYAAIERHARAVETVVDLGANTGLVARWILHRHPAARIVCVEPEPGNLELLERNLGGRGAIVPACVGASERTASLATSTGEWGFRMSGEPGEVAVTTMARVLADHGLARVDVLKCDIEGAECTLLENYAGLFARVDAAVFEFHPQWCSVSRCRELLTASGLTRGTPLRTADDCGTELFLREAGAGAGTHAMEHQWLRRAASH
jgi:FkbM family methyltransferase